MNRLGSAHRRLIYAMVTVLFVTGAAWAWLRYLSGAVGLDVRQALAANAILMKVHGGAAMVALVLLGTLLPRHVRVGWKLSRNGRSGVLMLVLCGALVASGHLLYYAGGEAVRHATSWIHLAVGLALPLPLAVHVWRLVGQRRAARASACAARIGEEMDRPAFAAGIPTQIR